jgi:hypothetical protein
MHSSSSDGLAALFTGVAGLVLGAISLISFVIWVWLLIHAITNNGLRDGEKIMWVLVMIFLPCLGSILYFFIGRPKKR